MIHLNELRGLCDRYQRIASQGLRVSHFPGEWDRCLEKIRRCPQCEERYGLEEFILPGLYELLTWAAVSRFIWLCDQIFRAECEGLAVPSLKPAVKVLEHQRWFNLKPKGKDAKRKKAA